MQIERVVYSEFHSFTWLLAGLPVSVVSKPGLPSWDSATTAENLAAGQIRLQAGSRLGIFGSRTGALAAWFARQGVQTTCLEQSWLALTCARLTLEANQCSSTTVLPAVNLPSTVSFDSAIICLPKGRQLARRWLVEAYRVLPDGGALYLAGARAAGFDSVLADGRDLFANGVVTAYKHGERLARLEKQPASSALPSWAARPGIAPGSWIEIDCPAVAPQMLASLPGVFSSTELDEGSALLLQSLPGLLRETSTGASLLDLGCGWGALGLAAAVQRPDLHVSLLDADLLAVASVQENIQRLQLSNASVSGADLLEGAAPPAFDLILSNPPFHAGKETNYTITQALIEQAFESLASGGRLALVANRFLRYEKILVEHFRWIETLAENNKFHVLAARK